MVNREREILRKLRSPHISNLAFSFASQDSVCLVLDYCRGGDLYALLQRSPTKSLSEDLVRWYAASIILGLEYLHGKGVIHRDIKPGTIVDHRVYRHCSLIVKVLPPTENILIDEYGYAKLTDFGVSEELDAHGSCKATSGTPPYMAPECFTPSHVHGPSADFFSLGITLFQLIVGSRPCTYSSRFTIVVSALY